MAEASSSVNPPNQIATTNLTLNDPLDPFYLHSNDNSGLTLTSSVFDGSDFASWKQAITIAVDSKNKLGLLTGEVTAPEPDSPRFPHWRRCNTTLIFWLLNSLSKLIAKSMMYRPTAKEIWDELIEQFGQSNGTLMLQAEKEIRSLSQGSDSITTYFTKLRLLWDEYDSAKTSVTCKCTCTWGATQSAKKAKDEERLIQFLVGLNDSYRNIRGSILIIKQLPSVNQAYGMMIQEEAQRSMVHSPVFDQNASAMYSSFPRSYEGNDQFRVNFNTPAKNSLKKVAVICSHCKKPGHVKAQCYRLHGFPSDFKFTKNKSFYGHSQLRSDSVKDVSSPADPRPHITGFSQEQISDLMNLMERFKVTQLPKESTEVGTSNYADFFDQRQSNIFHSYKHHLQR